MKNRYNLPDWLVESIQFVRDKYDSGDSDFSTTTLNKPPMIYVLEQQHEVEQDAADLLPSYTGTMVHDGIEDSLKDNERYVVEERFYRTIYINESPIEKKEFLIGGQIDLFDRETQLLWDHKNSSIYKFLKGDHDDYVKQHSVNKWIMEGNGYEVKGARVSGFPSDWKRSDARYDPNYPQIRFVPLEVELWDEITTMAYIKQSILDKLYAMQGKIRPCSAKERWQRPNKYALMKEGSARAIKLYDSKEEAVEALKDGYYVEDRPGKAIRCEDWCDVRQWCPNPGPIDE